MENSQDVTNINRDDAIQDRITHIRNRLTEIEAEKRAATEEEEYIELTNEQRCLIDQLWILDVPED